MAAAACGKSHMVWSIFIEKVCSSIPVLAPYTTAIEFGLLVLILMVRPTGLMGKTRREKV